MTRLIHLNGPPGIGKSTLARRYAADHPGVLVCDIDLLRTLVGGWESRFGEAGALIRPAALAMITAYLSGGHDVVLPQLLVRPEELARFEGAATARRRRARRALRDGRRGRRGRAVPTAVAAARTPTRGTTRSARSSLRTAASTRCAPTTPLWCASIEQRPGAVVVESTEGDVEATYAALLASLADPARE